MSLKTIRLMAVLGLFSVLSLLFSGCSTPSLKGTPYYSTETDTDPQSAKDRIPLWPILYYKSPTLSVLWPFFEISDEYMALRPLASVYGLDQPNQNYSLLWPLGQFDRVERANRFFPMFWGEDYVVGFPLYWHFGHPCGSEGGTDALIPAWYYTRNSGGYSLHLVWPFINFKDAADGHGWRVWPLIGSYSSQEDYYRFLAWPLCHQWGKGTREKNEAVLPLYVRGRKDSRESWFYSLLYSRSRSLDRSWDLLLPAYYSSRQGDRQTLITLLGGLSRDNNGMGWVAVPLLAGGKKNKAGSETWWVGPLAHFGQRTNAASSHVFPLYYSSSNQLGRTFLSLPWSSGSAQDGSSWQFVPPIMFRMAQTNDHQLYTLLYTSGTRQNGTERWQSVHPLWYSRESPDGNMFATVLGGWQSSKEGLNVLAWPLLTYYSATPKARDLWTAAGIAHFHWGEEAGSSHVLPLYYQDPDESTFISLPWSRWTWNDTATNTLVAPLLSWMTERPDRSDLWAIGPLAHASWGNKAGSSHVFPLFYRNPAEDTFVSLPYAHWNKGESEYDLYPPLLSMMTHEGKEKQLDALLGLFSERWGGERHEGYLLPFYYHDNWSTLYTLLFGWNQDDPDHGFYYPLTPLIGVRTGKHSGGWLFPLWSRDHDPELKRTTGTVLWGSYFRDACKTESSLIPIFGYKNRGAYDPISATNSWDESYGKTFWSLPACWYRNTKEVTPDRDKEGQPTGKMAVSSAKDNGFFPLWSYTHLKPASGPEQTYGSFLMMLYDYKTTQGGGLDGTSAGEEYVRKRVLWRLYHYERRNQDVSVDIFPAITYDRTKDGFLRWAFLWRAFRYERSPEGKKLDLLYIPLMRSGK